MLIAARALLKYGGGYVCVDDDEVQRCFLAIGWDYVGSTLGAGGERSGPSKFSGSSDGFGIGPLPVLAFVGLAGVPDYGLTEKGLIDSLTQSFIPVVQCCRCPTPVHEQSLTL